MSAEPLPTHYSNFADCPAMKWTTGTVEKWLDAVGKSKWTKFLVGKMKVDGVALMSLRKEDLTIALSNGYDWVELKSLMDSIRSLRVQQTCNPGQILSRYLSSLSISESSEASKRENSGGGSGTATPRKEYQLCENVSLANDETLRDVESETDTANGKKEREGRKDSESSSNQAYSGVGAPPDEYPSQYGLTRQIWTNRDGRFPGYICRYYTPNNFYIRAVQWDNEVARMEQRLTKHYHDLRKLSRADLFVGMACCVNEQDAKRWLRGRLVKTIPENGILHVECVDYGYTVESLLVNVRELPAQMVRRPPLCLPCKVEGGTNASHDEDCRVVLTQMNYEVSVELGKLRRDRFLVRLFNPHTGERVMQLVPE